MKPAILIVNDDADTREGLAALLKGDGRAILLAANAREALKLINGHGENAIEVILLDLHMPVMDGWEFLSSLRQRQSVSAPAKIIVPRAQAPRSLPGIAGVMAKPVCI